MEFCENQSANEQTNTQMPMKTWPYWRR